jgi:CheY-like chemotaxis protein
MLKRKEPKYKYSSVLLIDDNELDNFINVKMIEATLFSKKVYLNTNGKSAIEFLNNLLTIGTPISEAYPKVIFIDLNMPMIDGFQFADYLTKNIEALHYPKIIILTSSVYHEDREKVSTISKDIIFLNKPLTREMLELL